MFRSIRPQYVRRAVLGLLLGFLAQPGAAQERHTAPAMVAGVQQRVLTAIVNGVEADEPIIVRRGDTGTWVAAATLRTLGLRVEQQFDQVPLESVKGLSFVIDETTQSITFRQDSGKQQHLHASSGATADDIPYTPNDWGLIVNYDGTASVAHGGRSAGASIDTVVYTPRGFGYAQAIATLGSNRGTNAIVRLDTGYTLVSPERMIRFTAGDFITSTASFSRAVRMGGLKVGTDFSLRPDLVTFPVPAVNASAAVPSAVDLVVNGSRRALGDVKAGQFSVSDIPVVTGINTISVAVRDALGRQTKQTVTTYASRALLATGLTAWSGEAGFLRTGYASADDRYRAFALSGSVRTGLSDRFTLEGHAEGGRNVVSAGIGGSLALGRLGLLDISAAGSIDTIRGTRKGTRLSVGFERISRPISLSARYTKNSEEFADLASRYGSGTRSSTKVLNIGFDLGRFGTAGATVIDLGRSVVGVNRYSAVPDPSRRRDDRATLVNATYSARLGGRFNLVANIGTDLRQQKSLFASVGVLAVFGNRRNGYVGTTVRNGAVGGTAEYVQNAVVSGDFGYRASVSQGAYDRIAGGIEYLGQRGRVAAEVERTDGATAARVSARGSLILSQGEVLVSDTVSNSFAIVDTKGHAGITIYRDNRPVGITNRQGKLLVPQLNAFQSTTFSIDPTEIDNDVTIDAVALKARPMERVGIAVRFDISAARAARVRLVDDNGRAVPAGTRAMVDNIEIPVGLDGEIYLRDLKAVTYVQVKSAGQVMCEATIRSNSYVSINHPIGPVVCAARNPNKIVLNNIRK